MPVTPNNAAADASRGIQLAKLVTGAAGSMDYAQGQQTMANSIPVTIASDQTTAVAAPRGSWTDRSGSMTTGGTSQQVAAANTSRNAFEFQNISSETMWIRYGSAAAADTAGNFKVLPDAVHYMSGFISTQAINVVSATTGSKFTAVEG